MVTLDSDVADCVSSWLNHSADSMIGGGMFLRHVNRTSLG
ncbi:hypothetical protein DFJ67_4849 [Asanoa ferruginea]|uniref:Uncharacterized protein n=1 Tax=Asanoa ferruginea TaxID=53367 RepID=A0A3D9ZPN4_9ACTN|nr:hypothetical protein DFJ67_4849 [Asanoa ferruginea]